MFLHSIFQTVFKLLLILTILRNVECETFVECDQVPSQTFTASTKSCSTYIYCNGEESFEGQCDDGSYFNDEEKVCDDKEFVDCHIEDDDESNTTTSTTTTTIPTNTSTTNATTILPFTNSTVTMLSTTTVEPTVVISTTTALSTTVNSTLASIATTTTTPIITYNECPPVDNPFQIVFLASTKSCSEYFVCINGTPIEMFCSGMLHFNAITGKCDYPENVGCMPDYSKPKEQCRRNIVDFYPHISNCNYYYRCQNGFLMLQQCPLFYGWDIEKRNCVAINKAKCYA